MNRPLLAPYTHYLRRPARRCAGWAAINQVVGNLIESEGPFCSVGESCEIIGAGGRSYAGEIIGFRGSTMLSMAADHPQGIRFGDQIDDLGRAAIGSGRAGIAGARDRSDGQCAGWKRRVSRHSLGVASMVRRRCRSSAFPFASRWAAAFARSMHFHLRPRAARRHLRRKRRGQEHADRHDGARNRRRHDGAGAGRRTRTRSRRVS